MTEFDDWADCYDLIHHGLPGEVEFYGGQALRLGGRTLELGGGTGRIALVMALSGVEVTGLDNSARMLEVCRAKRDALGEIKGQLRLIHADMSDFDLGERFRFIAMPYRSFMHLSRQRQQRDCLRLVHKHLDEDGVFIMNTWIPSHRTIARNGTQEMPATFELVEEYALPDSTGRLRHFHRASFDEFRQRIVEEHLLQEVDGQGQVLSSKTLPLTRVWTTLREMGNLVRLSGFTVDALFGDFDCAPVEASSTEAIWILKKAP